MKTNSVNPVSLDNKTQNIQKNVSTSTTWIGKKISLIKSSCSQGFNYMTSKISHLINRIKLSFQKATKNISNYNITNVKTDANLAMQKTKEYAKKAFSKVKGFGEKIVDTFSLLKKNVKNLFSKEK